MTKTLITICSGCNRNLQDVNRISRSGFAKLEIEELILNEKGFNKNTILIEDICVECSQELRLVLEKSIENLKKKVGK